MAKYKKFLIVALVCLNVALLVGLFSTNMPTAQAQRAMPYKTTDYVVCTVQVGSVQDAVVVIDLATRKMAVWKWNASQRKIEPIKGGRNLVADFTGR